MLKIPYTHPDLIHDLIERGELDRSGHDSTGEFWKEFLQEYVTRKVFVIVKRRFYISNHGRIISIIYFSGEPRVKLLKLRQNTNKYLECGLRCDELSLWLLVMSLMVNLVQMFQNIIVIILIGIFLTIKFQICVG